MSSITHYKQNWLLYFIEGILLVAFGLFAAFVPAETFFWMALFFGLLLVGLGIVSLISGMRGAGKLQSWGFDIVIGIIELLLGFYLLRHPGISFATFTMLAAIALLVRSIVAIFQAFDESLDSAKRALLAVMGTVGFLAGLVVWRHPVRSVIVLVWVLGIYCLVAGPIRMVIALEARGTNKK